MPSFDKFEDNYRTLFIRFKCTRCGYTEYEPLLECCKRTGDRGDYLRQLFLPKGWYENSYAGFAFCPKCSKAFENFLKGSTEE